VQGYAWYHYELKRATAVRREEVLQRALEWAASGRHYSFRRMDLSGANLPGVDLGDAEDGTLCADLSHSDLSNADFTMARLEGADLSNANVSGADFLSADLSGATLYSLQTRGARFIDCDFRGARIGSDFRNTDLAMSRFQNAKVSWSSFIQCNLAACDFRGADLSGTVFAESRLVEANLSDTNLAFSSLAEANLSYADLQGSILVNCDLRDSTLDKANLSRIIYSPLTQWPEGFDVPADAVLIQGTGHFTYTLSEGCRKWYFVPLTDTISHDSLSDEDILDILDKASEDPVLRSIPGLRESLEGLRQR